MEQAGAGACDGNEIPSALYLHRALPMHIHHTGLGLARQKVGIITVERDRHWPS